MSVITHGKTVEIPGSAGQPTRAPIASPVPAILSFLRKAVAGVGRSLVLVAEAHTEARMQSAKLEVELYRNRYRHASKNDDDLPIIRSAPATSAPGVDRALTRARNAVVTTAKRVLPVILAMAIFTTILVAIIAIKMSAWLPMYLH